MNIADPTIETARLILRPIRWEDFDDFAAFLADTESTRFLGGTQSRPLAWRTMMTMAGAWHLQRVAFEHLGWTEVIHSIVPANLASQAVARKLGSHNRGPGRLPPPLEHEPIEIWGQTREEWRARPRSGAVSPAVPSVR